jgi:predicted transcriptional regulator YdeE
MKQVRLQLSFDTRRAAGLLAIAASIGLTALGSHASAQSASTPIETPTAKVEEQQGFAVIGLSVRTSGQKEAGGNGHVPALWARSLQDGTFERIPNRTDDKMLAVYTDFDGDQTGVYIYTLGARVSSAEKVPDGMVAVTIPAGRYAVVQSDNGALPDIMPKVWKDIAAMSAKDLGGERSFKTDYVVFPAGFDWQDTQVEVHVGVK